MKKTWITAGVLFAILVVVALLYPRWSGGPQPGDVAFAPPPPAPSPAEPAATPGGARVEFAVPVATPPSEERRPPRPRKPRPPAARPAPGTVPKVQAETSAPRLGDYLDVVAAEIAEQWRLPGSARGRTIPVILKIARDGRVLWALVDGSSGDPAIDESVAKLVEALKRDGLSPLPDGYPYEELDVGLVLDPAGR